MRGAKGEVNPAALFFGENMNLDSRMRFMGEKPFNMPSFKDPRELTHAVNELINNNDNIGDSEARWLTAENNHRLAAMLAEMDFEDISPEAVARVTRRVQSRLLFLEAADPMMKAFKEELKGAEPPRASEPSSPSWPPPP